MTNRFCFRPKIGLTLLCLAGILAGLALGNWQLGRAKEKLALQQSLGQAEKHDVLSLPVASVDPQTFNLRRVEVKGVFVPENTIYLDNKIRAGIVGYEVITPLQIAESRKYVLVNRGWIKAGTNRNELPPVPTPIGQVQIIGIAIIPTKKNFELSSQTVSGKIWQNLVIDRYRKAFPLDIHGFVIQQESALSDGLVRERAPIDTGVAMHQGYAFQWFALAALVFIIFIVTNVKRSPNAEPC